MLNAAPYRDRPHTVLVIETKELLNDLLNNVTLSPLNSGATRPFPWPRGPQTFQPLATYPYETLRRRRRAQNVVVELAVEHAVENISKYVLEIRRMRISNTLELHNPAPLSSDI